jgi:hypothetical protein
VIFYKKLAKPGVPEPCKKLIYKMYRRQKMNSTILKN